MRILKQSTARDILVFMADFDRLRLIDADLTARENLSLDKSTAMLRAVPVLRRATAVARAAE